MAGPGILVTIAGIASLILGGIVVLTASLFINDYTGALEFCDVVGQLGFGCKVIHFYIAAGSLGIIAGLIQIASYFFVWKNKLIPFAGVSIVVALLCVVAVSLAIDQHALDQLFGLGDRASAFVAFLIIDMIVAVATAVLIFIQSRK